MVISRPRPLGASGPRSRQAGRRSRSTRPFVLLGALVSVVALGVWLSARAPRTAGDTRQSVLTYLAELRQPLVEEAQIGHALGTVESTAYSLQRQQLVTDLVQLDETSASTAVSIETLSPVGISGVDIATMKEAALDWQSAARSFEIGTLASLGSGTTPPATGPGVIVPASESRDLWAQATAVASSGRAASTLSSAAQEMSAADSAYRSFRASLPPDVGSRKLPPVSWTSAGSWTRSRLVGYEQDLASAPGLQPEPKVAMSLASVQPQPIPASGSGRVATIVGNGALTVTAVVANPGNVDAKDVVISVSIRSTGTAPGAAGQGSVVPAPVVRTSAVDLVPGARQSVLFTGIHLVPGFVYSMTASVKPVAGQSDSSGTSSSQTFALIA